MKNIRKHDISEILKEKKEKEKNNDSDDSYGDGGYDEEFDSDTEVKRSKPMKLKPKVGN